MAKLLCFPKLVFFLQLFSILLYFFILQICRQLSGKPSSCQSLNKQSCLISPLLPHLTVKIHPCFCDFICSFINEKPLFLHLSSYLSLHFCGFRNFVICLGLPCKAEFVIGFFLISLCSGIPVFSIVFEIVVASNERFFFIYSDNFDEFGPLVDNVAFLIFFDNKRVNRVEVIDFVLNIKILVDMNILGVKHWLVGVYVRKLYNL